jgi:hypothetical protein
MKGNADNLVDVYSLRALPVFYSVETVEQQMKVALYGKMYLLRSDADDSHHVIDGPDHKDPLATNFRDLVTSAGAKGRR